MIVRAAQEVVAQDEFDDMLDTTRDRVDQIEGAYKLAGWNGIAGVDGRWVIGVESQTSNGVPGHWRVMSIPLRLPTTIPSYLPPLIPALTLSPYGIRSHYSLRNT
jgi:hypothetical protein